MKRYLHSSEEEIHKWNIDTLDPDPLVAIFALIKSSAWNASGPSGKITITLYPSRDIHHNISWKFDPNKDELIIWEWYDYEPEGMGITYMTKAIEENAPGKRIYTIKEGDVWSKVDRNVLLMIMNAIKLACR